MIREASEQDVPRIVELGSQSLIDGPYRDVIKDNPAQAMLLALQVLKDVRGKILLYENDFHKIVGLLAFFISPNYFTGEPTANEIMWYVTPDERKGGGAIKLLWEAEKLAKWMGAKHMGFTAPTNDVAALYSRFGYRQLEVSFVKAL